MFNENMMKWYYCFRSDFLLDYYLLNLLLNIISSFKKLLLIYKITFNDGYLGSCNDEERSEMRYVMRIAEFCELSNF